MVLFAPVGTVPNDSADGVAPSPSCVPVPCRSTRDAAGGERQAPVATGAVGVNGPAPPASARW